MNSPGTQVKELAIYLQGVADAMAMQPMRSAPMDPPAFPEIQPHHRMMQAARWLHKLSGNVCRHGVIGCFGGDNCTSDHK